MGTLAEAKEWLKTSPQMGSSSFNKQQATWMRTYYPGKVNSETMMLVLALDVVRVR